MKSLFLRGTWMMLMVICSFNVLVKGQINVALTAVSAHSGGGAAPNYGPALYNDNNIPTYLQGGTLLWGWVSSNGWIEYTWSTAQTIDSVTLHNGGAATNRHFTSLTLQYWNGTAYVNIGTISGASVSIIGYRLPSPVTTTRLRFNTIAGSNPAFREIQAWSSPSAQNDAGVLALNTPQAAFCPGNQAVNIQIKNWGTSNLNQVNVNWSVNGVNRTPVAVSTPIAPQATLNVSLGTENITAATALKFWTSNPNNVADENNMNDTFQVVVEPTTFRMYSKDSSVCLHSEVKLNIRPNAGLSFNNITWFNGTSSYTVLPGVNDTVYTITNALLSNNYYATFQLNGQSCTTDTFGITVVNPQILSVTDTGACFPDSFTLEAVASPGATVKWFDDQFATAPIHTGNTYQTPNLSMNTTYWVSASVGNQGGNDSIFIPLANGNTTGVNNHMFRVQTFEDIVLDSVGIKLSTAANTATSWNIYYRPDDYTLVAGGNTSNAGWILLTTTTNMMSKGSTDYTIIATGLNLPIPANSTYSLFFSPIVGALNYATNATGTITATNADLRILAGHRGTNPFSQTTSGGQPIVKLHYTKPSGCESAKEPVNVRIHGDFSVDLGSDINQCVDEGSLLFLNARNAGMNYHWDNNYNGQVRVIDASGTYWVTVDNGLGCHKSDTVNVTLKFNPVSDLITDTQTCINAPVVLDAGDNGISYYWNNGATTPQTTVKSAGIYTVSITGANGCVTTDTAVVMQSGQAPLHEGIYVRNINQQTFSFALFNPEYVTSVAWDFGDGSPLSYLLNPTHSFPRNGNYTVRLVTYSACGSSSDTTTVHITGLSVADNNYSHQVKVYPNPANDFVNIELATATYIRDIQVVDVTGRTVQHIKDLKTHNTKVSTRELPAGIYVLIVATADGLSYRQKIDVVR
ncbi:MAG: hypothetical protein BGO09_06380 [Bacteroidetes bacterium 47-18]|nr:MAG: hypothetical protein BGO09_06380 [Bacteroidetes bacterium 47-18]